MSEKEIVLIAIARMEEKIGECYGPAAVIIVMLILIKNIKYYTVLWHRAIAFSAMPRMKQRQENIF